MNVHELFELHKDEFFKFARIENPLHVRPDICAMLYMHNLFGGNGDILAHAEKDEVWFDVAQSDVERLTEEQVIYLHRCGIRYDSDGGLCSFV